MSQIHSTSLLSSFSILAKSQLRAALYSWATLVGMIAGLRAFPPAILAIEALVAMFSSALAIYIYNDVTDLKLDKISAEFGNPRHINRPLVTGKASTADAKIFVIVQTFISLGSSLLVNIHFFFFIFTFMFLGFIYSTPPIHLKNRFLLKQLTIAVGQTIASLVGGVAVGSISMPVIYLGALFFALTFGVVPILDINDLYGDEKMGRKTLPVILGSKTTVKITMVTVICTILASVFSYPWIGFNFSFLILSFSSLIALLLALYNIYRNLSDTKLIETTTKRILRPIFLMLHTSILLGIIQL